MAAKECKWWSRPFFERSSSERATGRSRSSTRSTSKSGRARWSPPTGFADHGYMLRRGHVALQGAAELKALLQEIESTYLSAGGPPEAAEDIDN
jgi:hypothetical protein